MELRRGWENRSAPILYSSPHRQIPLGCTGPGFLSRILVGAYVSIPGNTDILVSINGSTLCNVSSVQAIEGLNVYECVLSETVPVPVGVGDYLDIVQRNTSQVGFIHDRETDTPLISVITSKLCLQ